VCGRSRRKGKAPVIPECTAEAIADAKQDKERLRQRKIDEAKEMLNVAMAVMEQSDVRCVSALRCASISGGSGRLLATKSTLHRSLPMI